jgi:hypothetical protein
MRVRPRRAKTAERKPPQRSQAAPHRHTTATVRELPRRRDDHLFDATW